MTTLKSDPVSGAASGQVSGQVSGPASDSAGQPLRVLLYSDDATVRLPVNSCSALLGAPGDETGKLLLAFVRE